MALTGRQDKKGGWRNPVEGGLEGGLGHFEGMGQAYLDKASQNGGPLDASNPKETSHGMLPDLPLAKPDDDEAPNGPPAGPLDVQEYAKTLPPWYQQLTVRAVIIGAGLGIFFAIVQQRLGLQAGVSPGFGLSSCIIGFGAIRLVVVPLMVRIGMSSGYYHPQETTIIQTTANSVLDLNWAGGFHSFLVALSGPVLSQFEGQDGITASDIYEPTLGRLIPYQVCIAFIGIFVVLVLRKAMIIDFCLPWPSPTAAGVLIKSLHTKRGAQIAIKQLKVLGIALVCAFLWDMFEWFFAGASTGNCTGGFGDFPTLGLNAYKHSFYFNWEWTYVAIGILVPHIVNGSMMLGAIIMFGIILPIADKKKGEWYPDHLSSSKDVRGPYAYQVFGALGFFLGEGLYTIIKVISVALLGFWRTWQLRKRVGSSAEYQSQRVFGRPPKNSAQVETEDERRLSEYVFMYQSIPWWVAVAGYLCFTIIGSAVIPQLYPPAKWYYCLVLYLVCPTFSIINGYCAGLTDWDITSAWSTLGVLIVGAWAGPNNGGVVAALIMSGISGAAVNAASSILGDFKTGYYTLVNPRAMLATQLIGEIIGLVMAPVIFYYLYYLPAIKDNAPLGSANSQYAVPQAYVNLAAAIVSTAGISELPKHCFEISGIFFLVSIFLPMFRDFGPRRMAPYIPTPMAMGIPLVVGGWLAVDMCMGSGVKAIWQYFSWNSSLIYMIPTAAGVIAGEGLWAVPEAILALCNAQPPICMQFYPSSAVPKTASG